MDLLHKVRVLFGALARKPFAPHREKVDLSQDKGQPQGLASPPPDSELEQQQPQVTDTGRVADLIGQQQRREAG